MRHLLQVAEVAAQLGLTTGGVNWRIRHGHLRPFARTGLGLYLFDPKQIRRAAAEMGAARVKGERRGAE